jgi:hypothetical protein
VRTGMESVTSCFEQSNGTSNFIKCKENFLISSETLSISNESLFHGFGQFGDCLGHHHQSMMYVQI